ncbi:hypothetical protein OV203_39830 [Nannocystis sp. ILAH1]|uniref:hypothetical protein n=1 Tax=unclassified Nannocystis TaxID=2627009 RepID=UPI00226E0B1B|nr:MULTISPECIES: hypothetical protein [unclassified Nannocystis]MCY0993355.1 hypothetical protein [Nannocystis sp. ILAH1]MCY1063212.1 hypothetical protein [Nannocystis sp. RBIL2]
MRPRVAHLSVLVLWGCLRPNPGFDGASDSASASTTAATTGTSTGTGTITTGVPTTGPASTTDDSDPTAVAPSTTTTTIGTTVDTTTGLPGPVTLRPYELANCVDGPFCMSGGDPVSAKIEAVECFTAPAAPPLQLTRLGFQIRFAEGEPTAKLDVLPYDPGNHAPVLAVLDTRDLGPIPAGMAYRSFDLDPPVLLDIQDFCLRITGGGATSTLVLNTDHEGMAPGDGLVAIDDPGDFCDSPLTNLREWYDSPFAHFCLDVDIDSP